ncbi:MAG: universal stress protein [Elusimicrobia bacterium]|nr:universal stress protein [Elusimicrobiota bacterium]
MKTNHALRFPPKRILVPLDLSDVSMAAWQQAVALARKFGAKVDGLYVQPWLYSALGVYSPASIPEPKATASASQTALRELRSRLGQEADVRVVPGAIEPTILSWGRDLKYDLVVMGTHGRTWLEHAIQGSIAETVMRHATIPVMIVRGKARKIREVMAPVNFEPYSIGGLEAAGRVAEALGAGLTVLHVIDFPVYRDSAAIQGPKGLMADAIADLPENIRKTCRPRLRLSFGKPAEEIVAAAEDADLIVLVAHRKGFLSGTLLGTTAERVLRHSTKPVLAIPSGMIPARKGAARAGKLKK